MQAQTGSLRRQWVFVSMLAGVSSVIVMIFPLMASADIIGDRVVTIAATDTGGTPFETTFDVPADGILVWHEPFATAREIFDGTGTVLAYITDVALTIEADPAVDLGFVVFAGPNLTTITVTSPTVSFSTLSNPDAWASAGITLTDGDGTGATATGLQTGSKVYQARYNAGTEWANLIPTLSAGANSTNGANDRRPGAGWETISDNVSSIQAEYKFSLTASDQAGGTSRFEVVPEPATVGLLAIGLGAVLTRRRRH